MTLYALLFFSITLIMMFLVEEGEEGEEEGKSLRVDFTNTSRRIIIN